SHFLSVSARNLGVEPKRLSAAATEALLRFPFPGNVRQLENICHWLTVMAPSPLVDVRDLPPELRNVSGITAAPAQYGMTSGEGAALRNDAGAVQGPMAGVIPGALPADPALAWLNGLEMDALARLRAGEVNIMQDMTREFER